MDNLNQLNSAPETAETSEATESLETQTAPETTYPTFDEHMASLAAESPESAELEQSAEPESSPERPQPSRESEGFKRFEVSHPEIAAMMRASGVPLNEADFRAQGYKFSTDERTGVTSIYQETEAYRAWKAAHPGEKHSPKHLKEYRPVDPATIAEYEAEERQEFERRERNRIKRELIDLGTLRALDSDGIEIFDATGKYCDPGVDDSLPEKYAEVNASQGRAIAAGVLLGMVENGVGYDSYHNILYYAFQDASGTLHTENYKNAFQKYHVNPYDDKVRRSAFKGFTNTIMADPHGFEATQTDWYFKTFDFASHPEEYFRMKQVALKEYQEAGIGRRFNVRFNKFEELHRETIEQMRAEIEANSPRADQLDREHIANAREVSGEEIDDYIFNLIDEAQEDGDYFRIPSPTHRRSRGAGGERTTDSRKASSSPSLAYAKAKIATFSAWKDYIHDNVDPNARYYVETVGNEQRFDENGHPIPLKKGDYLAIQFEHDGKSYCIAESTRDNAAMYVAWGEAGQDLRETFRASSKHDVIEEHDNVARFNHVDKEHPNESLDQCYFRAFFTLFSGAKPQSLKSADRIAVVPGAFSASA